MNVQSDIKAGEWNPPLPKKKSNLEKLGKAIQDLQGVYFDLEHGAETDKISSIDFEDELTKERVGRLIKNSKPVSELKPPTPEEMDKILYDTYAKIEAGLYAITQLPDLSLEEAKNYNKSNTLKMEKKIIGYKLKDEKYRKAVELIAGATLTHKPNLDMVLESYGHRKMKELEVLDLWFEPVYKEEKLKLETGKWYRHKSETLSFICEPDKDGKVKSYGIQGSTWYDDRNNGTHWGYMENTKDWTPATDKEVESALIEEAKKRGYKDGVETEHGKISREKFGGGYYEHELEDSGSFFFYNIEVFKDGQWAEIVSATLPEIGGYQGEDLGGRIEYGCTCMSKSALEEMSEAGITSFNLKVDGKKIKVSKAQTKQLFEYINKE